MNLRRRLLAAVIGTSLVLMVPAGSGPAHARAEEPTLQPGPGSYLAVVSHGHQGSTGRQITRQSLVLISPTGQTRTVLSQAVGNTNQLTLADWSADGLTALLESNRRHGVRVVRVDVATGQTTTVDLGESVDAVLLAPDGSGFVAEEFNAQGTTPYVLQRVTWTGATSTLSASSTGSMLPGRGDTVIVGGATSSRVLRTIDYATGQVLHQVRPGGYCIPVRWWDATRVLATCGRNTVLVDPGTGQTTTLVPRHGSDDYGHLDVRRVASGYYVQVAGACGTTFVAHQAADGSVHEVHVPGAIGNVVMVATVGRRLVIQHEADCGGGRPRSELSRFDPVSHREQPLVEVGPNGSLERVLVYGEVRASTF